MGRACFAFAHFSCEYLDNFFVHEVTTVCVCPLLERLCVCLIASIYIQVTQLGSVSVLGSVYVAALLKLYQVKFSFNILIVVFDFFKPKNS